MDEEEITYQLVEGRKQIAEGCGISEDEVVGHRSPYLQTKSEVRRRCLRAREALGAHALGPGWLPSRVRARARAAARVSQPRPRGDTSDMPTHAHAHAHALPAPAPPRSSQVKDVLKANGFTYDSSDIQSTRGNMGSRGWPSSMGGGMTQVALQDLSAKGGSFTMDYGE